MIYVTGDLHGDVERLKSKELKQLKKHDYLIVCGDFGFLWDGSAEEQKILRWLGKRRYHILFLEGTHDNLDLLESYPKEDWYGGQTRLISGKLRHLCRGEVFELEGKKIFAFGGGAGEDTELRKQSGSWWASELPSEEELELAQRNLEAHNYTVDYIVTHQPSRKINEFLTLDRHANEGNHLDAFLDEVRSSCKFKQWFFGSLHLDKQIPPSEIAVFRSIVSTER